MTCITRRPRRAPAHMGGALAMVLPLLACGSRSAAPQVLAVETGTVTALAFAPGGRLLAVGTTAAQDAPAALAGVNLQVWDLGEGRRRHAIKAHDRVVRQVAFDAGGRQLYTLGRDGVVQVWDVQSGQRQRTIAASASAMALAGDGRRLVTYGGERTVQVWDAATGAVARAIETGEKLTALALAEDGRTLALARAGLLTDVFDLESGQRVRQLASPGQRFHAVESAALSRDGRSLALGRQDSSIEVWDVASGALRHRTADHRGFLRTSYPVLDLAFGPTGAMLVSGGADGTVRLWDADSGRRRATLAERSAAWLWANPQKGVAVQRVAVSPDGSAVAAGHKDRTVRLWRPVPG